MVTVKHRFREGLKPEKDLHPRAPRLSSCASPQRGPRLQAPPATRDQLLLPPHLSSALWPGRHLWPDPRPSSHLVPSQRVFRDHRPGECGQGAEAHTAAPGLASALTFWILFSAMGQGGRRGHRPVGGGWRVRGRRVVVGSVRSPLGWINPAGPRLAARQLAPAAGACSECARARVCASVREGTPARLFCFRFCFWEGACALPARARPAWHTGKCSSSRVPGRRPLARSSYCWLQPRLRTSRSWVGLCNLILIKLLNLKYPICKRGITN